MRYTLSVGLDSPCFDNIKGDSSFLMFAIHPFYVSAVKISENHGSPHNTLLTRVRPCSFADTLRTMEVVHWCDRHRNNGGQILRQR